jgi:hypothetical protein
MYRAALAGGGCRGLGGHNERREARTVALARAWPGCAEGLRRAACALLAMAGGASAAHRRGVCLQGFRRVNWMTRTVRRWVASAERLERALSCVVDRLCCAGAPEKVPKTQPGSVQRRLVLAV